MSEILEPENALPIFDIVKRLQIVGFQVSGGWKIRDGDNANVMLVMPKGSPLFSSVPAQEASELTLALGGEEQVASDGISISPAFGSRPEITCIGTIKDFQCLGEKLLAMYEPEVAEAAA